MIKQPIRAYDPSSVEELKRRFLEHDCDIRRLVVDIVTVAALVDRSPRTPPVGQAADSLPE